MSYPEQLTLSLDGAKILRETWGENTLQPLYDNEDSVCGIIYNNIPYYFHKNLQGDIIAIADQKGIIVARYTYDAWGKCTIDSNSINASIANINPFRYRGYYYDSEIGMYYLQSRYYDPETSRFVNGDMPEISTMQGDVLQHNLYAYCGNEPINRSDENGYFSASEFWQFVNSLPIVKRVTHFAGFAWDNHQGIWYSLMDPIQRKFGYCDLYDTLAPLASIFISHKKMPFTYNGKSWMIWIWKGQYGITTGAEIGLYVYSKTLSATVLGKRYSQKWYRCANNSERINMSFTLYKNGKKMFSRGHQKHWWLTGFKPGIKLWWEKLTMYITLGFKDLTMAKSFCSANGLGKPSSSKVSFWW